jgi:hypothetical protein
MLETMYACTVTDSREACWESKHYDEPVSFVFFFGLNAIYLQIARGALSPLHV